MSSFLWTSRFAVSLWSLCRGVWAGMTCFSQHTAPARAMPLVFESVIPYVDSSFTRVGVWGLNKGWIAPTPLLSGQRLLCPKVNVSLWGSPSNQKWQGSSGQDSLSFLHLWSECPFVTVSQNSHESCLTGWSQCVWLDIEASGTKEMYCVFFYCVYG